MAELREGEGAPEPERPAEPQPESVGRAPMDFTITRTILGVLGIALLLCGTAAGIATFSMLSDSKSAFDAYSALLAAVATVGSLTGAAVALTGDAVIRLLERAQR